MEIKENCERHAYYRFLVKKNAYNRFVNVNLSISKRDNIYVSKIR